MNVYLRQKKIKNGKTSLYLDFYPPVKGADGRFTRREFLKKYLYQKPKNDEEKRINKTTLVAAETIKLKYEKDFLSEGVGIFNAMNKKRDFLEYFKQLSEKRKLSKGNYDNWSSAFYYLSAFTNGKCSMGEINEDFCEKFKIYLLSANKLKTINDLKLSHNSALSYFNKFRASVNAAYESRFLNDNPLRHVKGIQQKETKREFLTMEELQKLAQTKCGLPLLKTAALFSALTGLRWSDIENLKWKDIQYTEEKGYFLHITQQKTQDTIMHPINNKAAEILGLAKKSEERVFSGLAYSDCNNDKLKDWVSAAGIGKKITLHNFRHTYATLLLNKGVDIFTVSKMLGHRNIKTTMIYAKVLDEKKVNAANLIDISI